MIDEEISVYVRRPCSVYLVQGLICRSTRPILNGLVKVLESLLLLLLRQLERLQRLDLLLLLQVPNLLLEISQLGPAHVRELLLHLLQLLLLLLKLHLVQQQLLLLLLLTDGAVGRRHCRATKQWLLKGGCRR